MKKIINNKDNVVKEMIQGIVFENNRLKAFIDEGVIVKKEINPHKVALISGGGSGHEPMHAGFIGKGMLDAAVCGEVFTSPTPIMIEKALDNCSNDKGTLLIVKNYSGDVMNFEIAKTLYEVNDKKVEMVIVNDDVAVEDSTYTTGRRGVAGTIFVHKVAGAAAEEGKNIDEVKKIAEKVIANTRTMGMSIGSCTLPANGKPSFEIKENEMEIGLGIHGEPGIIKELIKPAKKIVAKLLNKILNDIDYTNSEVALLINGLGATPLMELYIINNDARNLLKSKNINVVWNKVGNYTTSLEMPGFSITLLRLDSEIKKYLETPTDAKGWK